MTDTIDKKIDELEELVARSYWTPSDITFLRNSLPDVLAELNETRQALTCCEVQLEREIHMRDKYAEEATHAKERAEKAETQNRVCTCIWCGNAIASYRGIVSDLPADELVRIRDACREHDNQCAENSIRKRAEQMQKERDVAILGAQSAASVVADGVLQVLTNDFVRVIYSGKLPTDAFSKLAAMRNAMLKIQDAAKRGAGGDA